MIDDVIKEGDGASLSNFKLARKRPANYRTTAVFQAVGHVVPFLCSQFSIRFAVAATSKLFARGS